MIQIKTYQLRNILIKFKFTLNLDEILSLIYKNLKVSSTIKINFIYSKDTKDEKMMRSKRDNMEDMSSFQILNWLINGFDCVNFKFSGTYIDYLDWVKR